VLAAKLADPLAAWGNPIPCSPNHPTQLSPRSILGFRFRARMRNTVYSSIRPSSIVHRPLRPSSALIVAPIVLIVRYVSVVRLCPPPPVFPGDPSDGAGRRDARAGVNEAARPPCDRRVSSVTQFSTRRSSCREIRAIETTGVATLRRSQSERRSAP